MFEVPKRDITLDQHNKILDIEESHFVDLKDVKITPSKLSRTISALANAGGGEVYVGISEFVTEAGKERRWDGFPDQEAANPFLQILTDISPLGNDFSAQFLKAPTESSYVLHITIFKSQNIIESTEKAVYIRRGAQNLPIKDKNLLDRLRYDKGIISFEDETISIETTEITNSETTIGFVIDMVPEAEPDDWMLKQRLINGGKPTVAGVLLFSDLPQAILPKRSSIKILRYKTKDAAERDFLGSDPITIEGPIYDLIYEAVDRVKSEIEAIQKMGPSGLEKIQYPHEALHELLTNAVLHRDYSFASDVQVRIFDNRIEIESPGKLPGHVTPANISRTQLARNPKIVRLINKFPNPPNKDVGEGVNTAFEAMGKLRLRAPEITESDGSVIVILKHESLASPEQMVMEYLKTNNEITNAIARDLTGIKSENSMKQVFYRLRDSGQLEQIPKIVGKRRAWRLSQGN